MAYDPLVYVPSLDYESACDGFNQQSRAEQMVCDLQYWVTKGAAASSLSARPCTLRVLSHGVRCPTTPKVAML